MLAESLHQFRMSRRMPNKLPEPPAVGGDSAFYVMQTSDQGKPVFAVYVGEKKVATLHDPRRVEMFWCSYRVEPTSEDADKILHDKAIWEQVAFTVRSEDGSMPNSHTFTGGDYVAFCLRQTDRLSFRSLWPPAPPRHKHDYRATLDAGRAICLRIWRRLVRRE